MNTGIVEEGEEMERRKVNSLGYVINNGEKYSFMEEFFLHALKFKETYVLKFGF